MTVPGEGMPRSPDNAMPPRAGGQHRPPRADNGEGELKLYGVAVQASPRLRAPAPDAWRVSHPPESAIVFAAHRGRWVHHVG